jgi:hypothetical protein
MEKIDYKKELEHLYKHSANKVGIVEVPQMNFLMIDGEGDPNTSRSFQDAIEQVGSKNDPRSLPLVTFELFAEGKALQIMHIGPFSEEGPTVKKVYTFIDDSGCKRTGKHHEIYLSDILRSAPKKLRMILS